jgi:hypothetical protein
MPWRPQPDRIAAHDRVRDFWRHFGFRVIEANSNPDLPFNLSVARNNAARQAQDADVLILADADTIPDIASVLAAVDDPQECVTYPFHTYLHIPGEWVTRADLFAARPDQRYNASVGGIFVCTAEIYWELRGMDERFYPVWGYEDNAFAMAAHTICGIRRLAGTVFSFNHSAERDMSQDNPNKPRFDLYRHANGNPAMMRELIR